MTDLFAWIETATPKPLMQGPPRPVQITIAEALGLELIDIAKGNAWSDRYAIRCTQSGTMTRLAHAATWHDFCGADLYLTEAQAQTVEAWNAEVAA